MISLIPSILSTQIDPGVIIKPNSTQDGYYIVNTTVYTDTLEVYEENATFTGLDPYNTTIAVLDSGGSETSYLSDLKTTASIPQTSTIENITFRVSQAVVDYAHRFGAGIISEQSYKAYSLASIVPYILVAMAVLGVIGGIILL